MELYGKVSPMFWRLLNERMNVRVLREIMSNINTRNRYHFHVTDCARSSGVVPNTVYKTLREMVGCDLIMGDGCGNLVINPEHYSFYGGNSLERLKREYKGFRR